ncbi:MAG: hypothetical protein HKN76_01125, partial [Saprospiraceae bacterium]|nr:hypothetical protein [Saprospiraceae bacterium]
MKATNKAQVGTILENQKHLMDTLIKNTNAVLDLYSVKEIPGVKVLETYQKETQAYLQDILKPENSAKFIEEMPKHVSKAIEIQNNFYKASLDYTMNIWKNFDTKEIQKKMDTASKIYKDSTTAIVD